MSRQTSFRIALGALLVYVSTALGADPPAPVYSCQGFEPPMNLASIPPAMGGGVIARRVTQNKILPFKATLVDSDGNLVTNVVAAPRIQVQYDEEPMEPSAEVVEYALWAGNGSEGNAFALTGNKWQFNLKANGFNAPNRYTVTIESGDTNEYLIDPTCKGVFLVE